MDVNLAKVGQNLSWPTRDINALLETRDNYCDILLENGWTLLNRLLLTLIRKIVGVSKHRRKNGCSGIGLLSNQEPREFFGNCMFRQIAFGTILCLWRRRIWVLQKGRRRLPILSDRGKLQTEKSFSTDWSIRGKAFWPHKQTQTAKKSHSGIPIPECDFLIWAGYFRYAANR